MPTSVSCFPLHAFRRASSILEAVADVMMDKKMLTWVSLGRLSYGSPSHKLPERAYCDANLYATITAIILTCWHLVFATLATQLLARTTSLLDSRHSLPVNGRFMLRTIFPIGLLYSGSLVCSNLVYLWLSVPFIQMLKSASPVVVLFFSWLWGLADPTTSTMVNIFVIVLGVAIASFGEISFSWVGFMFQVAGTVFEAMRLVLIQVMLSSEGLKMDPLVGLYYYAPVCAILNLFVALGSEAPKFEMQHLWDAGPFMLILNALVAFMLNIASVCLVSTPRSSSLENIITNCISRLARLLVSS